MITLKDLERIDLRVGGIVAAEVLAPAAWWNFKWIWDRSKEIWW